MTNPKTNWAPYPFKICIDSSEKMILKGTICSRRLKSPMAFRDINDLIIKIDNVMDDQNYPQSSSIARSFKPLQKEIPYGAKDMSDAMDQNLVNQMVGKENTLILSISSRLNGCWQGNVELNNKNHQFKSTVALINLIEELIFNSK